MFNGCSSANKVQQAPPSMAGTPVQAANIFSQTSLNATSLLGKMPQQVTFVVTDGKYTNEQWQFTSHSQKENQIVQEFKDQHRTRIQINDDKSAALIEENDFSQNAKVLYDPPIIVIPNDLSIKTHEPTTHQMTVMSIDGKSKRDQGTCTVELQIMGMQKITTPDGQYNAMLIKESRQLKLGLAQGSVTIYNAYAPKVGLIGHRVETNLVTLGFIPLNNTLELKRPPRKFHTESYRLTGIPGD